MDKPKKIRFSASHFCFVLASCIGAVLTVASTSAQISSDETLGTAVTGSSNFLITGGTTSGTNLFHSFSEFSIPTGGSAIFNNSTAIENILSRVTGGNLSHIDGAIAANGTANLFLLNPAGITFGSNAVISIGGSFFASTADRLLFADGVEFAAGSADANPLLSISAPVGLAFQGSQGQIRVEGSGHDRAASAPSFAPVMPGTIRGLQLYSGGTLALVGNGIVLEGGEVFAPNGRIEVASVSSGTVGLSQINGRWALSVPDSLNFADIQLGDRALIDASDFITASLGAGGEVRLAGRQISLRGGALVLLQNYGSQNAAGSLDIFASESVDVAEISEKNIRSSISTRTTAAGNAAALHIQTNQLSLMEGGLILSESYNAGRGGDITIAASESVEIDGFPAGVLDAFSALAAVGYTIGRSGDITLETTRLTITNGGTLSSIAGVSAGSGDIRVNASESIEISGGISEQRLPSSISVATGGSGNAGNVRLETRQLLVREGARVDSSTVNRGEAGSVEIIASDLVEVSGSLPNSTDPSIIISSGNIVEAELARVLNISPDIIPTGNSGNVAISTDRLRVEDGGEVTVRNDGTGNAGTLQVRADRIELLDGGRLTALTSSGEGGNINLQASELLLMRRGALISAEAGGTGNGGNITLDIANGFIVAVPGENSDIVANALQGNGGNIDIAAISIFGLEFRDALTELSDITASSQFGTSGTVTISNPNASSAALNAELQGEVLDPDQQVSRGCDAVGNSRFIATGRGGIPDNPTARRSGTNAWQDVRDLSEFSHQSSVTSHQLSDRQPPLVEATGWRARADGTVEIYAAADARADRLGTTDCGA